MSSADETSSIAPRRQQAHAAPRAPSRAEIEARLRAQRAEPAPERVRRLVIAYALAGAALLSVTGIGLAGIGPFAA